MIQLVFHVSPPSNEKACSQRADVSVIYRCSPTPRFAGAGCTRATWRPMAPFPAMFAELEPSGEETLLRMRAESLDWVAGLLAGAGCAFTIRRPDALRGSVHAPADRLRAA